MTNSVSKSSTNLTTGATMDTQPEYDRANADLVQRIMKLVEYNPLLTDYEVLNQIADIVAQRQKPAAGVIDVTTGLRY